jgi:hypothetical protein
MLHREKGVKPDAHDTSAQKPVAQQKNSTGVTPKTLAKQCRFDERTLRHLLRRLFPHDRYYGWRLTPAQARRVRRPLGGGKS